MIRIVSRIHIWIIIQITYFGLLCPCLSIFALPNALLIVFMVGQVSTMHKLVIEMTVLVMVLSVHSVVQ